MTEQEIKDILKYKKLQLYISVHAKKNIGQHTRIVKHASFVIRENIGGELVKLRDQKLVVYLVILLG